MSELLDKQMNVQKEFEKTSGVYQSTRKPTKKVCDEERKKRKKGLPRKKICGDKKDFIAKPYQKNG